VVVNRSKKRGDDNKKSVATYGVYAASNTREEPSVTIISHHFASSRSLRALRTTFLALTVCTMLGFGAGCHAASPKVQPPKVDVPLAAKPGRETAIFAGGCFWGTQAVFQHVKGVIKTTAGYAGGSAATATYDQVTTETTNHAESVEIVYDPSKLTFGQLLQVFFTIHDPTTLNRQGNDEGTSYRSEVFATTPEQARIAKAYIAQLNANKAFANPVVTTVSLNAAFYPGEDYHQDYMLKSPNNPYILVCDRPKLETLKTDFPELYVLYKGK